MARSAWGDDTVRINRAFQLATDVPEGATCSRIELVHRLDADSVGQVPTLKQQVEEFLVTILVRERSPLSALSKEIWIMQSSALRFTVLNVNSGSSLCSAKIGSTIASSSRQASPSSAAPARATCTHIARINGRRDRLSRSPSYSPQIIGGRNPLQ